MGKDGGGDGPAGIGDFTGDGNWQKQNRIWIPQVDDQLRMDRERLSRELKIEEKARDNGRIPLPASHDDRLDDVQMTICGRTFDGILDLNDFLASELAKAAKAARAAMPAKIPQNIVNSIVSDVHSLIKSQREALFELRKEVEGARRDLIHFRLANKLNRDAHYESSMPLVIAIFAAMLLVESIANGVLLSEVMANGWLGGIGTAAIISCINVGLGILAGLFGWRLISHVRWPLRVLGVAITLACHAAGVFWNLLVAHFREVAQTAISASDSEFNTASAFADALTHMHAHGLLGLGSLLSWGLMIIGFIVHFVSAYEGFDRIADHYHDYRKTDVRLKKSEQAFDDAIAELREEAQELARAEVDKLDSGKASADVILALVELAQAREQEVRNSEDQWVTGANALLKTYRDINVEVRDKDPAPAYFRVFPKPEDYRRKTFAGGAAGDSDTPDALSAAAEAALEQLRALAREAKDVVNINDERMKIVKTEIGTLVDGLPGEIDAMKTRITREVRDETEQAWNEPGRFLTAPMILGSGLHA